MASYIEVTDRLASTYTRVMPSGDGVCDICHGQPGQGFSTCYSCSQTLNQVSRPTRLIVPISLAQPGSLFHQSMWKYKSNDIMSRARDKYSTQLACLLHRFLLTHGECIVEAAGIDWDVITIVPSTHGRIPHPLEGVVMRPPRLREQYRPLLRQGPGMADHNRASDTAFEVTEDVTGMSILVIDDTFTSGSRSQSAVSTLQLAGATVVAIVPIERHVKPGWADELLAAALSQPYDFDRCCLDAES